VLGAEPVVTVGLAQLFLGEDLSATQVGGALVTVASVVLLQRRAGIPPPRAPA
jgi:drug/metabolite transporter (DMT)-like permease